MLKEEVMGETPGGRQYNAGHGTWDGEDDRGERHSSRRGGIMLRGIRQQAGSNCTGGGRHWGGLLGTGAAAGWEVLHRMSLDGEAQGEPGPGAVSDAGGSAQGCEAGAV